MKQTNSVGRKAQGLMASTHRRSKEAKFTAFWRGTAENSTGRNGARNILRRLTIISDQALRSKYIVFAADRKWLYPSWFSVSAAFFALGGLLRCSARRRFVLPGTFVREENGTYVTTKIRDSVAITVVSAVMLTAAANVHASELSRERLLAVRTQEEFATLYKIISRKVGDDANRIVESLEKNGFSCRMGKTLFKAQCVFAYCGDRRLFLPTLPQRELMTINVTIERNDGVWTGVAHHQTACPETDVVLKQKQEDLLTGGTPRGGKK
ncbi:hypothetical protein GOE04_02425 [Sinorhizobium medicae]|nr:hypothetical protein [Sinorhizobium medicae]MDX0923825.1 hypothetical protein [Sinorhizobium medicae]MDX0932335.1 hypothetical protein [Sinorhizobium medicae]MDX0938425.1 hypothetical protein [Sinorhizobium medicae]MDX1023695.1 hypothetical protein [Sinorhizobium medicae]